MKKLFRSPAVQGLLAFLLAAWLRFCLSTTRWRWENRDAVERLWAQGGPVVICLWHSRLALAAAAWDPRGQDMRALISLSPDGEFLARAVSRLGFPAIRGSSTKGSDKAKAKGGSAAFREVLRWLRQGGAIALTPDGPRGPAEQMAEGAAMLARVSGAPVMLLGLAGRPVRRLDSWDRAVVPLPFARGAIVWDGPLLADPEADLEALRREWAARLTAATARAEAIVEAA